jgi:hypothetical protein
MISPARWSTELRPVITPPVQLGTKDWLSAFEPQAAAPSTAAVAVNAKIREGRLKFLMADSSAHYKLYRIMDAAII